MTPGNVHDSAVFPDFVSGDERALYADRGYSSYKRSQWLTERGIVKMESCSRAANGII